MYQCTFITHIANVFKSLSSSLEYSFTIFTESGISYYGACKIALIDTEYLEI